MSNDDQIPPPPGVVAIKQPDGTWKAWDENEEVPEPEPDPPEQALYELRLPNADLDGVVADITRYARRYVAQQKQPEIKDIEIAEWQNLPDEIGRIDRTQSRGLAIIIYLNSDNPTWSSKAIDGPPIWLAQAGSAVLLSFTNAYVEEARPFVLALIERCREVWGPTHASRTENHRAATHPTINLT